MFRRLVLARIAQAERLSEAFQRTLLSRVRSGFSVHGDQIVIDHET